MISIFYVCSMIEKIKKFEKLAEPLDPNKKSRKIAREKVIEYTEEFLEKIDDGKIFNETIDKGAKLLSSPINEKGISIEESLELFEKNVEIPGLNPASGGHLAYIPGGGVYYSSLGDYIAAITNRYAGIFYASPGAVRMTNMLIRWMADTINYPSTAGGNLSSGGSIANLTALATARDAHTLKAKDYFKTVIYCTEHVHHCQDKAIRILGLSECIIRRIPMDTKFRMKASLLNQQINKDKKRGLNPWLVIASAGTTDIGAIDPLDSIGDICKKENLWFHVDAAYGGFFMLTSEGKKKLLGIEKSDSVVMDPHKGLFLPYGSGVLLVKDQNNLAVSHYYRANYMQDALYDTDEISPADISPELTKHFRAMRMWLPLKLCGTKPFKACLNEKLLLAQYFYKKLSKTKGFEMGPKPELSVVTYRYIPQTGDPNTFNEALLNEVIKDGRIFISSTLINGNFTLRLAILSFRSHLKIIDKTIQILIEKANKLENN